MKRNFAREYTYGDFSYQRDRIKIGVFALGSNSGATFFALALAQEMEFRKKSTAFLELPSPEERRPLVYHMLDMDRRFSLKKYRPIFGEVENDRRIEGKENIEAGINWALLHPQEDMRQLKLTALQETKLINNLSGDYIICDLGSEYRKDRLGEMDIVFCIVDPLPSKLIASREAYQKLMRGEQAICWVLNKDNGGINRKSFYQYAKIKGHETIPMIEGEFLYRAEYNCRLPYEQKEVKEIIKPIMEKIVSENLLDIGAKG